MKRKKYFRFFCQNTIKMIFDVIEYQTFGDIKLDCFVSVCFRNKVESEWENLKCKRIKFSECNMVLQSKLHQLSMSIKLCNFNLADWKIFSKFNNILFERKIYCRLGVNLAVASSCIQGTNFKLLEKNNFGKNPAFVGMAVVFVTLTKYKN
ncbi:hypothetical protein BpHYR1_045513 [Brachionus plicatilis]|uniref:Uncharacterized protein n=1 Tax=Brachionus plicatilis TaxID=10195 RepID=A0A3M7SG70_BRAPC|nr:hypothetical protein BpHYR1_045513 [Brachionus plicatilis]